MNRTSKLTAGLTLLTCVLAALILLPGCGNSPVAPANDGPYTFDNGLAGLKFADSLLNADDGTALAKYRGSLESAEDAVTIGLEGGVVRLRFDNNSEAWLEVPEGALSENVTITAAALRVTTRWGQVTLFDFHPDGLVFNVPAVLTLQVDARNGTWLRLWWYNPESTQWEVQEEAEVKRHKVTFKIYHFSKYGIS